MNPITLDTADSQECHKILDWIASTLMTSWPCMDCGAEGKPGQQIMYVSHRWDCMVMRSYRLIEGWSHA